MDCAPDRVYRSAAPWNWMVSGTIPAPAAFVVSTFRYPSLTGPVAEAIPRRPASVLLGLIAIRLPPPLTQVDRVAAWVESMVTAPRTTTSYEARVEAESVDTSIVLNSLRPSVRRISARYFEYRLPELVTTAIGPPGPCSGPGGGGAPVVKDQLTGAIVLLAASFAPLTEAV